MNEDEEASYSETRGLVWMIAEYSLTYETYLKIIGLLMKDPIHTENTNGDENE